MQPDEGQAEGCGSRCKAKSFAAQGAVVGGQAGKSAAAVFPVAAAAKFLVGDGSPVPSGRHFQSERGTCPLLATGFGCSTITVR